MEQEIFQRKQFTFYASFYQCIEKTLKKKSEKLAAYQALAQYALFGTIEGKENIPDSVLGILAAICPILDTARQNSKSAKSSHESSRSSCDAAINPSCYKEKEYKNKKENKTQTENKGNAADFERFWSAYPKKVGKLDAARAFAQVQAPVSTLLQALQKQKAWPRWTQEQGRFIPHPAKWLRDGGWNDECTEVAESTGELELQAIRRIMDASSGFS